MHSRPGWPLTWHRAIHLLAFIYRIVIHPEDEVPRIRGIPAPWNDYLPTAAPSSDGLKSERGWLAFVKQLHPDAVSTDPVSMWR